MASTWSNLKFELIGTGDQSGTWGATTNDNLGIAIEQAIGGKADVTMSSTTITLTLTDTTALQNARALYLNLTGTPGGAATLNVPAVQKAYIVYNNTTGGFAVTVKVSGQTGVSVPNGKSMLLYDNGTDVVDAVTHLSSLTLGSALPIGSGGTGLSTTTAYGLIAAGTTSTGNFQQVSGTGTSGQVLTSNGAGALPTWQAGASGDVTTSGNNAFTGANTFYNATGQAFAPATTNDGIILQGRAGGSSSYRVTFATATLSANRTLTFPDATDTAAVLGTAQTFTALQTFSGSTSVAATKLANAKEVATISATAATGTINYDITTQSVLYYTSNASANWTVNFRGSSGTSLDTLMSTGESMTVAFLVTQGSTAYYNSAVQVDGSSVTPKYQGGAAWSAGNASSIDAYVYTIVKTGSAAFTVFASQTQFK